MSIEFWLAYMTILVVDRCFIMTSGGFAGRIESRFRHYVGHHLNQIPGALIVLAAILLALKEINTI